MPGSQRQQLLSIALFIREQQTNWVDLEDFSHLNKTNLQQLKNTLDNLRSSLENIETQNRFNIAKRDNNLFTTWDIDKFQLPWNMDYWSKGVIELHQVAANLSKKQKANLLAIADFMATRSQLEAKAKTGNLNNEDGKKLQQLTNILENLYSKLQQE